MNLILIILLFVIAPGIVSAASLVSCTGVADCNYQALLQLLRNVINYLVFTIAVPAAAIGIAVGGGMILFAGGDDGKISTGRKIVWTAIWGLVIALGAFAIVNTIWQVLEVRVPLPAQ